MDGRYRFRGQGAHIPLSDDQRRWRDAFMADHGCRDALQPLACVICGSVAFEPVSEIDRYGFYYPTGLCTGCGNVQQTAYYTPKTVAAFYAGYYRNIHSGLSPAPLFAKQAQRGQAILAFVTPQVPGPARVLELGTGAGGILAQFAEAGHSVVGCDFDEDFLAHGRTKGLELRLGGLETLGQDETFDLVILSHVLEHVVKPGPFLSAIRRRLTPDGMIYVEVPAIELVLKGEKDGDFLRYLQIAHVCHFSEASFANLCRREGFSIVKSDDVIRALIEPDPAGPQAIQPHAAESRALLAAIERRRREPRRRVRRAASRGLEMLGLKELVKRLLGRRA